MTNTELRELVRLYRTHLDILLDRIPPDPPLLQSTEARRAEVQIRNARWLLEQAIPIVASMPQLTAGLTHAQQLLGEIGGDYREGEAIAFQDVEDRRTTTDET